MVMQNEERTECFHFITVKNEGRGDDLVVSYVMRLKRIAQLGQPVARQVGWSYSPVPM